MFTVKNGLPFSQEFRPADTTIFHGAAAEKTDGRITIYVCFAGGSGFNHFKSGRPPLPARHALLHFDSAFINRLLVGNIEYILLVVSMCAPNSLIGEISIASGQPATATVVARAEIHYLARQRAALHRLMKADAEIAHAVERSLRRNLESTLIQRTKPAGNGV